MAHIQNRCLQVPELVENVVDSLLPAGREPGKGAALIKDRPTMTTLARLARTSKTFHGPAIGRLWETQFGIQNLIMCMPADLVSVSDVLIRFGRGLQPSDWERFDYYAAHVRVLVFPHHFYLGRVTATVYAELAHYSGHPRPYLPQLRSLTFKSTVHSLVLSEVYMSFLGPSVKHLAAAPAQSDTAFLLEALVRTASPTPSLDRLDLDCVHMPSPSGLLVPALSTLRRLKRLDILLSYAPPEETWETIAELPLLASLSIEQCTDNLEDTISLVAHTKGPDRRRIELPQVNHLRLIHLRISDITELLNRFDLPKLTVLDVTYQLTYSHTVAGHLLEAVRKRCPPTLSELRIGMTRKKSPVRQIIASDCPEIRYLNAILCALEPDRGLNDDILFNSATAWPALKDLVLTTRGPHTMFGATLLGMAYIAEVCDHLRTLKLDFDTSPEAMKEAQ